MVVLRAAIDQLKYKYSIIKPHLNERSRRIWSGIEASSYGHGGIELIHKVTGLSKSTIRQGIKEINQSPLLNDPTNRIRKKGGGRKSITTSQPGILEALQALISPFSKGDPEKPLLWTSKSVRKLAKELCNQGYKIVHRSVSKLLHQQGYSLQSNKKTLENSNHKDRDAQFKYINESIKKSIKIKNPIISVDIKKKENIGNYKNNGQEYAPKGKAIKVKGHDFIDKKLGKVVPYGVYDIGKNKGWVSVGISSDTAKFAVNTIRTWWLTDGIKRYPQATELTITADCGGSNGYRTRLWKIELQQLANELKMKIKVHHFPSGTSKWNKIEHRLFSYISKNWRGKPLINRETVVNLIRNTTTEKGLTVSAILDKNEYETGLKISDEQLNQVNLNGDSFHPEWNYSIANEKN